MHIVSKSERCQTVNIHPRRQLRRHLTWSTIRMCCIITLIYEKRAKFFNQNSHPLSWEWKQNYRLLFFALFWKDFVLAVCLNCIIVIIYMCFFVCLYSVLIFNNFRIYGEGLATKMHLSAPSSLLIRWIYCCLFIVRCSLPLSVGGLCLLLALAWST